MANGSVRSTERQLIDHSRYRCSIYARMNYTITNSNFDQLKIIYFSVLK